MATAKPSHESEPLAAPQHLVAGRFNLLAQIGRGRLGDIYEAEDIGRRQLGITEHAAVQLLSESVAQNNGLFDKLELGYTVLRSAAHPGIVAYLDIGHDNRYGYVVMELLKGASMRVVLENNPTLPPEEVVPVVRALGDALQFLHSKSIVHGKVTAENVFVTDDLDVRLLDVVPLASADAVLRGVAEQDPFSRDSVQDDVFALACLAYEMLGGKHPFNYEALPDVLKAGLQPARIDALPEKQWIALRRALVQNEEESIRTIAEFLHEFGVTGTERLRGLQEKKSAPREQAATPPPAVIRAPKLGPKRQRKGRLRLAVLFFSLVGLGAWYLYGAPQERLVAFLESVPALSEAIGPDPEVTSFIPIESGTVEPAVEEPMEIILEEPEPFPIVAFTETETPTLQETPPDAPAQEVDFAFDATVVTVSEADSVVRIDVRVPKGQSDSVSWWTSGHAAAADEDYVVLSGQLSGSPASGDITTLHIPLVNDTQVEQLEDFFVHLGRREASEGRLVPIDTLRVDIVDDD